MRNSILTDALFSSFDSSIVGVDEAQMLPPACYTNEEFFELESEAIFNHEWLCVGRESWAKNVGDYFTSSHIGEPIIIVRNREGVLKALSAVCQHRAMLVAEGRGNTKLFRCPYHHWAYSLDGDLAAAPAMERACHFDKSSVRLPQVKIEVWLGFVFINFDSDAPPLAPRLETLRKAIANYHLELADGPPAETTSRYPWNWKVLFENNNDGYHANRLHEGIHDVVPSALARFPELPSDTAAYFRYNGMTHKDGAINPLQKAILRIFPDLTDPQRREVIYANIPPTLTMGFRCDQVGYFIIHADAAEEASADQGVLYAPGAMDEPLFNERRAINSQASVSIGAQDRHVDALVQRGLRSRYANRGRYSWQEATHREFNKWLVQRYRRCWRESKIPLLRASAAE